MKSAMVLRSLGPPRSGHSLRKEKTLATIVLSLGPVRKNHLSPFSVSVGDAQGWQVIGRPALSTTGCRSEVMPLVPSPLIQWTLFTEMQLLDERARLLAAALVVPHDELDRRAAQPREALARPQRHLDVGVVVVDDVLDRLRGPQVLLAQAGEVARQRQHRADEDLGDLRLGGRHARHAEGDDDEHGEGDDTDEEHVAWETSRRGG